MNNEPQYFVYTRKLTTIYIDNLSRICYYLESKQKRILSLHSIIAENNNTKDR